MKNVILALCALTVAVTAVTASATKISDSKPQAKAFIYIYADIGLTTHRATFGGSISPGCATPYHQGNGNPHTHGFQLMHTNACSTSGNWWNADKTIWQLKRSWCVCEGWGGGLNCSGGAGYMYAYCYI